MKRIHFLLICLALFLSGCIQQPSEEMIREAMTETALADITEKSDITVTEQAEETKKPIPTAKQAIPTRDPNSEFGKRSNPFPLGTPFEGVYDDEMSITLTISKVIRGSHTGQLGLDTSRYNQEAVEGQEYLLTYVVLNFIESKDPDGLLEIKGYDFKSVSNNKVMEIIYITDPEPDFDCELYVGGSCEGWITFLVYKNDPSPLIRFEDEFFFAIE